MTLEEIRKAAYAALEERRKELLAADGEAFDVEEANAIAERMAELEREGDARRALEARARAAIDSGAAQPVDTGAPGAPAGAGEQRFDAASPEYRTAWLKSLARSVDVRGFDTEMSDVERRAFTFTTGNSGDVVPTATQNRIIELVDSSTSIYADLTVDSFSNVYEVPRHKSIVAGDAKVTDENTANEDEQDAFDLIAVTGEEIRKHIKVSRKMQVQSIDAFEEWVVRHLAARMGVAKEKLVISRLQDAEAGMAAANKLTTAKAGTVTDSELLKLFACLKTGGEDGGAMRLYASNTTIWTVLAEVKDANGHPLYKESTDPAEAMLIHGTGVKKNDCLPDGVILAGYPRLVAANSFDPMSIMADVDVITREKVISAYELFDCVAEVPEAWGQLTVKSA